MISATADIWYEIICHFCGWQKSQLLLINCVLSTYTSDRNTKFQLQVSANQAVFFPYSSQASRRLPSDPWRVHGPKLRTSPQETECRQRWLIGSSQVMWTPTVRSPDSLGLKGVPRGFTTLPEISGVTSVQILVFSLVCLKNIFFILYSKVSRV